MGDAKAHYLTHSRMVHQYFIDFTRTDFFTTTVDDFFQPASDADVALAVHHTLVARAKPALGEIFRIGLVVVFIARGDVGAANHNFTGAASRQQLTFGVHDGHFGTGWQTHGARLAFTGRQRVTSHLMRRFGHAIGFNDGRMKRGFKFG